MEQTTPLIDHWSYSSMSLFLRNRLIFKKKYIEHIYDDLNRPSSLVGQACHKAVEVLLRDGLELVDEAIQEGLKVIAMASDATIDYGKTGTREKMIKEYHQGINFYLRIADMWYDREVLEIEKSMTETIRDGEGKPFPIPAKCFSDVIWRTTKTETFELANGEVLKYPKGTLLVEDHKFVRSYADPDILDPARLLQSMFNFHIIREKMKEEPAALLFNETKLSENKDKTPQSQYYVVDFKQQLEAFDIFYKIYNDCSKEISRQDVTFLPNFFDMFDGENAYLTYRTNLIGVEAPFATPPKTKQVAFKETAYVESATDKVENKNLTQEEKIRLKLQEFGIPVEMKETHTNGSIVMYTMKPSRGVKMSAFNGRADDLALALKAKSIRVQAPIMGTDLVGVELPADKRVFPKAPVPSDDDVPLRVQVGMDVYGKCIEKSLADMPHLLVAGTTGSGKSVFLSNLITSLTTQHSASEMGLVLIDPKRVELSRFKGLPHLLTPPIYDSSKALTTLKWLVDEMETRYSILESKGYRDITEHNSQEAKNMQYIVVIVDEFSQFMMRGKVLSEGYIVSLAQMARAIGIHLVLATQRPTVNVITGLIKANLPTRVCFMVTSKLESQIVLDESGAEELNGKGDMLFMDPSIKGLLRLQAYSL